MPMITYQVAARSRQLLIEVNNPSVEERRAVFTKAVSATVAESSAGDDAARLSSMDAFVSLSW